MVIKEFLQLRHDRRAIPVMVIGPLAQLLALGYAANRDVADIPLLVHDQDRSAASRALVDRFVQSGYFTPAGTVDDPRAIEPWLVGGRADIALSIDAGYGEAIAAGRAAEVQVIADGTDASSAVVGLGHAGRIIAAAGAAARTVPTAGAAARRAGPGWIDLQTRVWYNPDLSSRWFYVPAILAMVLMLVTMILPSMAIVREKEVGTLEQLIVTPVRPWQLILGKLLPFAVIGLADIGLVTLLATALFGVPLRGSFPLLVVLTLLFLLCTLGLGLLVSSVVRTQQQAMMASTFLLMVPMIYLSGLIFPIENMPAAIQRVTTVIPVRYYAIIVRGIFLRGSGLQILWPETAALLVIGLAVLSFAALRFRKRLD
jgi:ABC-2 type transport system permease protein